MFPELPWTAEGPIWGRQTDWSDLMSAVERLDDGLSDRPEGRLADAPIPRDVAENEAVAIETQLIEPPAGGRARLRPLLALAPYVTRYRWRAVLALISLTVAAVTTL